MSAPPEEPLAAVLTLMVDRRPDAVKSNETVDGGIGQQLSRVASIRGADKHSLRELREGAGGSRRLSTPHERGNDGDGCGTQQ